MDLFNRNRNITRDGFVASMRVRRATENVATEKNDGSIPSAELSGVDVTPACEARDRTTVRNLRCLRTAVG